MASSCSFDSLNKMAKGAAQKVLKIALSVLLAFGFLPVVEQEAIAAEGNVKIASVYASPDNTYVIAEDGSLYAWGANDCGQVGDGTFVDRTEPAKVLDGVAKVCDAGDTVYAVAKDGSLYAWGENGGGQVGIGTQWGNRNAPVKVMDNVVTIHAFHEGDAWPSTNLKTAYAITKDGSLYAWGANDYGQIGDGTTSIRMSPLKIMDGVIQVYPFVSEAGGYSAHAVYAITKDGSLYAWGSNNHGQVGDGTLESRSSPVKVMSNVATMAYGPEDTANTAYAITKDGSLYAWGSNNHGQVGDGTTSTRTSPVKIANGIALVDANASAAYAVGNDGALYAWGYNGSGQIGDGTTSDRTSPVKVLGGIASVSVNGPRALGNDGSLYAWGAPPVGDNSWETKTIPIAVMHDVSFANHVGGATYAITNAGTLYAWGDSQWGQLGEITGGGSYYAVRGPSEIMDGVSGIYASVGNGNGRIYAVTKDGALYEWGKDPYEAVEGAEPGRVVFPGDSNGGSSGGGTTEPDAPTSSETIETKAYIRAGSENELSTEYPITWDNDWFKAQDNGVYDYNSKLAIASAALSASAYSNESDNEYKFVTTTLNRIGFGNIDTTSYDNRVENFDADYKDGYDKVAYAFASKKIPDGKGGWDTLVVVVVRGTPGNVEWISNANINDTPADSDTVGDKAHEGFSHASQELHKSLDKYLEKQGINKENAKFLLTGHSRGAAVANITAARLNEEAGKQDVYAYCFATPRVTSNQYENCGSSDYDNIINVVNPEDFVPRLPLAKWGYERYGRTFYLPCKSTQKDLWKAGINRVGSDYYVYFDVFYDSFGGTAKTDRMIGNVYSLAPSVYAAYNTERLHAAGNITFIEYFRILMNYIAYKKLGPVLTSSVGAYISVTSYFAVNHAVPGMFKLDSKAFGAHSEKTYLTWLRSLDEQNTLPIEAGEKCDTGRMTMYCPVDVTVYDPDGNVVARIVDDVLDEELAESDEGLAAYVDPDTGAKSVWVPLDQGYRVETVATDEGTLDVTWSVSDPEGETLQQEARVDLPLEEGTTYTAEVSDQGTEGAFEDSMSFVDESGEEIEPDFESDAESAGSLEVSVSATEGGSASGNAQATAGDHVTVSATALPGYLFDGWYEGEELFSSEAAWTFRAEESRSLEARFVPCEHPNGVKPCEDCGYREIELSDCELSLEYDATIYDGTYKKPALALSCDGIELTEGEDYTLSYANNRRAGTATVTATAEGGEVGGAAGVVLLPSSAEATFRISKADLGWQAEVAIPYASCVYNGKVRRPAPTVKVGGVRQLASEYEVTYWNKARTKKAEPRLVGAYWVRVKAKASANTEGTAWKRFLVNPKATANLRLARLNNGFKASWAKRTVQCSGYQVQYRLVGKTAWTTKWAKGCRLNSKKVAGLKDRKTYQVRVRAYKTVNGSKYYSAWTPVKKVKTK